MKWQEISMLGVHFKERKKYLTNHELISMNFDHAKMFCLYIYGNILVNMNNLIPMNFGHA